MEFEEVLRARQSIRRFDPSRRVTDEEISRILEAAIAAPSAGNLQAWFFVVVKETRTKAEVARGAGQPFVGSAPVVIVVCADLARIKPYGKRGVSLYCIQDTAAAAENILLAVASLGLGACWVGAFDEGYISQALELPETLRPVVLIPVGYPTEKPRSRPRRPLSEVSRIIG